MLVWCKCSNSEAPSFLGALLWYSDPTSLEREMLPPILSAHRSMIPRSKRYLPKAFTLINRTKESYVTFRGSIQKNDENQMWFQTDSYSFLLDFKTYHGLNEKLLGFSDRLGKVKANTTVPVLEEDRCVMLPRSRIKHADKIWVSGLLLSRIKVTMFGLRFALKSFILGKGSMLLKDKDAADTSNIFYAWWPSPKPSHLGEWLSYLSEKKVSYFPSEWVTDCTPFVEGFYRMALTSATEGQSKYDATAQAVFNDGTSMPQHCYTDYPYDPNEKELSAGFVHEKRRVRISISIPMRYRAPQSNQRSDWQYLSHLAMGYIFLLPGHLSVQDLCDATRSPGGKTFTSK